MREVAAKTLAQISDVQTIHLLIEALKDEDRGVRASVAQALGKIGNEQAMLSIIDMLRNKDLFAHDNITLALDQNESFHAFPIIFGYQRLRMNGAEALGRIGDKRAVPLLIDALKDDDRDVRGSAAEALNQIGDLQAVPYLIDALKNSTKDVRKIVAEVLLNIRTQDMLLRLRQ